MSTKIIREIQDTNEPCKFAKSYLLNTWRIERKPDGDVVGIVGKHIAGDMLPL